MKNTKTLRCIILICGFTWLFTTSCTPSGGSSSYSSIRDTIGDILNPDASTATAQKQIQEIQSQLNLNENYALTQEDLQFLESQGLISNNDDLKSWVK